MSRMRFAVVLAPLGLGLCWLASGAIVSSQGFGGARDPGVRQGAAGAGSQGNAGPREFRTAPLWGLGKRVFFLHDGRTSDLMQAIQAHRSFQSEANAVVDRFNGLPESVKQDLLNFLRSL